MQERQSPTLLETALLNDRRVMLVVLGAIPLAAWPWIVLMARDMYGPMNGAAAWMMTTAWSWPHVLLLVAMWAVMMTAMMLPTAAPLILLYAAAARRSAEPANPARRVYALAAGTSWCGRSSASCWRNAAAPRLGARADPDDGAVRDRLAGAVVLAIAGLYQLTPLKRACLRACRSPLGFMMQRWRGGVAGAFRLGLGHGTYCLGCCWALMLILFAGGVMNLVVIITLTVWVLVEKIAPFGELDLRSPAASRCSRMAVWMVVR